MPAGVPAPAGLLLSECTAEQRAAELARRGVIAAIDRLQIDTGCSKEAAMVTLLTNARAGKLEASLDGMLRHARDPRGRQGDGYPSVRTLKRWLGAENLTPKRAFADMNVKPWHALAIALAQRPQGSCKTWVTEQIGKQWHAALGEAPPSYGAVARFFRDKFSTLDALKGRFTGSQLRTHKFYQHRTSAGLEPWQEVHADGWNSHFTAPHPISGEFVTYEIWHFHDVATRYVSPPGIGLTENFEVIAKGFENCIRVGGVMAIAQTDSTKVIKGSERFTKNPVTSLEERLGTTIVHPKEVGNSQANGIAENFNTYLDRRSRELATYQAKGMDSLTFKRVKKITAKMVKAAQSGDVAERLRLKHEAERMGRGLVIGSFDQAVAWINRVCDEFNDKPHRSLPKVVCPQTGKKRHQTPRESLQEALRNGWEPTAIDEAHLVDIFRPHAVCKVTRETVSPYAGMRFKNSDHLGHWNGKDVVVAYDIMDWRQVWVKTLQGELICIAEFVEATGYRAQSAYEAAEEKRALAQIRRRERDIEAIKARTPGAVIEDRPTERIQTIADFLPAEPAPVAAPEKTLLDFLPEKADEPAEASYADTVMWLYGEDNGKEDGDEGPKESAAG